MINILRMNPSGTDGIRTIMTFEFIIDSTNDLPKDKIITLGERIYVIANDSIAINSKNNFTYSFNNGKWIKTNTKATPSNNTITSNGNYTIPSSTVTGTGNVDVNIKSKGVTLVDKEITENGTYLPTDDEATAYSKVVVDVVNEPEYYCCDPVKISGSGSEITVTYSGRTAILKSSDGNGLFDLRYKSNWNYENDAQTFVLMTPVNKLLNAEIAPYTVVVFTPNSSFDGFYDNDTKITLQGDEITPGDGKTYIFIYGATTSYTPYIKKQSRDFYSEIGTIH